jgi:PAS domain S-box-containing protein
LGRRGFSSLRPDASTDCIKVVGPDGALLYMNANGLCAMEIDDFSCLQGLDWASLWPEEAAGIVREAIAAAGEGRTMRFDAPCPTAKGTPRWWEVSVAPIHDEAGRISGLVSVSRDITERRRTEKALEESESRFRNLADQSPVMMWVAEPDGTCSYVSRSWREFTGRTLETPDDWLDCVHSDDLDLVRDKIEALQGRHEGGRLEYRLRRADGAYRWVLDVAVPRIGDDGTFLGFVGSVLDITERHEREQETRRYRSLVEQSSDFIGFATLDRNAVFANEGARRLVGAPEGTDLTALDILDFFLPEDRAYVAEHIIPPQLAGEPWEGEFRFRHFVTGEPIPVWYNAFPIKDEAGRVTALATVTRDVGAQKRVEAALRSSEEHLRVAQTAGRIATWEWNLATSEVAWSPTMRDLLGLPHTEEPPSYATFARHIHPDDVPSLNEAVARALTGAPYAVEFRIVRSDGELRWLAGRAEVVRDDQGKPVRMIGVNYDVTERREATDALAALNATLEARVQESAAKLAQLEKMESLGRLTGGIAHDFNNLLAVVLLNLELLQGLARHDPRMRLLVENAIRGAERGAALTERLLAFARKQELHPTPVDLGELVDGMRDMLTRSLGPRITIRTRIAPGVPPAVVDANQLEVAILNLAVNARDAMPDGGTVTIGVDTTTDSDPPLICIRVADTGCGMDEETLRHAMEPFYTTKEVGRGTGLGLSMVQGFAAQSGGKLLLTSTPGRGTTAQILLPVVEGVRSLTSRSATQGAAIDPNAEGGLHVLVVDDDEAVREGTAALLHAWGHTVTQASAADQALEILGSREFDALVTDQTMPGMTGMDLAGRARALRPRLPIVLMSGYVDQVRGAGDLHVHVVSKPIRGAALAEVVTRAIQAQQN